MLTGNQSSFLLLLLSANQRLRKQSDSWESDTEQKFKNDLRDSYVSTELGD